MDFIGRIAVPSLVASGQTFPLVPDFGYGFAQERPIVVHRFGTGDAKVEQRFQVGLGPRMFTFKRGRLSYKDRAALQTFWESMQGSWKSFTYDAPNADLSTSATTVTFQYQPLTFQHLANAVSLGLTLVEVPNPTPSYSVGSTCTGFPSTALAAALLNEVQQIIPLIHIRVREAAVPDIYLADRRVTVGGQLYLPRVIGLGEQGSDVILSQDIRGTAESFNCQFGNADRVMTLLSGDTDLKWASLDFSLFHIGSSTLLQLWKGVILQYTSDGAAVFPVQCSDILSRIAQQYPYRVVSRYCWKTFNDGVNCPWASVSGVGNPNSCDYTFDGTNGCASHVMNDYFGGHPVEPQAVSILNNATGFLGFDRSRITATSIIADSVFGLALQEVWVNDGGNPGKCMPVACMVLDGRDESSFYDALGIVGAGPIGAFTGMQVYTNADGYRYIISPMLDGFTPHGFKVDGTLTVTSDSTLGLREVVGTDPATSAEEGNGSFSLGQGSPQTWGPQRAAGTAFVEIRVVKPAGTNIQGLLPQSHTITVPISQGLSGSTFDGGGGRTLTAGVTNPFWVALNSFFRALGINKASSGTQQATFVLASAVATAAIADALVPAIVGGGSEKQWMFQGVLATQRPFRDWLTQILACALGYFTFEFGALKFGCRSNAIPVDSYDLGNILFQSLTLTPIEAAFEHLVISFADVSYQFQNNTAEFDDKDHAAFYGRKDGSLKMSQNIVGLSTLSQGLRLAVTRVREEEGGVSTAEWRNARNATWKSTILALTSEPGMVVSHTHPDIPGYRGTCTVTGTSVTWLSGDLFDETMIGRVILINGVQVLVTAVASSGTELTVSTAPGDFSGGPFRIITGSFRVQSRKLMKDYSIELTAKTVTDSMYDLTVGKVPSDVAPTAIPPSVFNVFNAGLPVTTNMTAPVTSVPLLVDTSSTVGEVTISLLPGALTPNQTYTIVHSSCDSNAVIIKPAPGETINGHSSLSISGQGTTAVVTENGTSGVWTAVITGSGYVEDTIVAGAITPDLSLGLSHEVELPIGSTPLHINEPIYGTAACVPAGTFWRLVVVNPPTGDVWATPTWDIDYINVSGFDVGDIGASATVYTFVQTNLGKSLRVNAPDPEVF